MAAGDDPIVTIPTPVEQPFYQASNGIYTVAPNGTGLFLQVRDGQAVGQWVPMSANAISDMLANSSITPMSAADLPGGVPTTPDDLEPTPEPGTTPGPTPGDPSTTPPGGGDPGTTPDTPPPPTPPAEPTPEQRSAKAQIQRTLEEFGLAQLGQQVWQQFLEGVPIEQIMLDLRSTSEYQARFPGIAALGKQGRSISEREYIDLEQTYTQIFRRFGLPPGFYDEPADFGNFIANEVSPVEIQTRVEEGLVSALQAPKDVRDFLQRFYGIGVGELTSFFLDPDRALPAIQRQFSAARLGAAAFRTGALEGLGRQEAETLATFGISESEVSQSFESLGQAKELFGPLPGLAETPITREQQLAAAFGLEGSAEQRERIRRRSEERRAAFQGGGGFASAAKGITGLGEA